MKQLIIIRDAEINGVAYTPSDTLVEVLDDETAALLLGCDAAREVVAQSTQSDDNLDALLRAEIPVVVGGVTIVVRELTLGQLPSVMAALKPALAQLTSGNDEWLSVYAEHSAAINQALSIAIGKERAFVDGLPISDGLKLLDALMETNMSFLQRHVIPMIYKMLARMAPIGASQLAGASSSLS